MKLLFIDTETTGLFDFTRPAHADGQPRLASFAAVLCEEAQVICRLSTIIRPYKWTMPMEATAIHGLTPLMLSNGMNVGMVLAWYSIVLEEFTPIVIAHNSRFDTKVMRGEMRRASIKDKFEETITSCTMLAAQAYLPNEKFPSLGQCVKYFFNEDMIDAHTASADVEYCRRLYFEIQKRKLEDKANGPRAA